jgi:hypothetical protein
MQKLVLKMVTHLLFIENLSENCAHAIDERLLTSTLAEDYSCEFGSGTYYAYCGLGGLLSCGITHTMVTPLDLVKCRLQVSHFLGFLTLTDVGSFIRN